MPSALLNLGQQLSEVDCNKSKGMFIYDPRIDVIQHRQNKTSNDFHQIALIHLYCNQDFTIMHIFLTIFKVILLFKFFFKSEKERKFID